MTIIKILCVIIAYLDLKCHITFRTQDVPEQDLKGIPLGVLAPVKECALASSKARP
jgi:hypothetical protein